MQEVCPTPPTKDTSVPYRRVADADQSLQTSIVGLRGGFAAPQ
jgi:hypothetical protein